MSTNKMLRINIFWLKINQDDPCGDSLTCLSAKIKNIWKLIQYQVQKTLLQFAFYSDINILQGLFKILI